MIYFLYIILIAIGFVALLFEHSRWPELVRRKRNRPRCKEGEA